MLHEILLALLGHTGSVIVQVSQTLNDIALDDVEELNAEVDRSIKFRVNPNLTFLSVAEIEQLNNLV